MRRPGLAEFPDAKTERGAKHLEELGDAVETGCRAVMLYLIQIGSATRFALARDIDPKYGAAFDRARSRGVEAIAWRCLIGRDGIEIAAPVPVVHERTAPPSGHSGTRQLRGPGIQSHTTRCSGFRVCSLTLAPRNDRSEFLDGLLHLAHGRPPIRFDRPPGPAPRHPRDRPFAAGRRQHAVAAACGFRRRCHQGRAAAGRSAARLEGRRPLAVLEGLWAQQALDRAEPARGGGEGRAERLLATRRRVHREFSAGHAGADGARAGCAARGQSQSDHRAHLRLRTDRALCAAAGLRHPRRGDERLCLSHRLSRSRAGAAAAGAGRHDRRVYGASRR